MDKPEINTVMSWLEGLADDDWADLHSDTEVQNIAKAALELLEEYGKTGEWIDHTFTYSDDIECPFCHKRWNVIDNCTETFDYCPGCGAKLS